MFILSAMFYSNIQRNVSVTLCWAATSCQKTSKDITPLFSQVLSAHWSSSSLSLNCLSVRQLILYKGLALMAQQWHRDRPGIQTHNLPAPSGYTKLPHPTIPTIPVCLLEANQLWGGIRNTASSHHPVSDCFPYSAAISFSPNSSRKPQTHSAWLSTSLSRYLSEYFAPLSTLSKYLVSVHGGFEVEGLTIIQRVVSKCPRSRSCYQASHAISRVCSFLTIAFLLTCQKKGTGS